MLMAVAAVTFSFADKPVVVSKTPYDRGSVVALTVTPDVGYHFVEWTDHNTDNPRFVSMNDDMSFEAVVEMDQYTILFKNWDGTVWKKDFLHYGDPVVFPETDPIRDATAQYSYSFYGWKTNKANSAVATGDMTFIAEFDSTINRYAVVFKNIDGEVLQSLEYEYGEMPTYLQTPTLPATAEFTYLFTGWDRPIEAVTESVTYRATYSSNRNRYTITVLGENGEVTGGGTYPYGTTVTITATPNDGYAFKGWEEDDNPNAERDIFVEEHRTLTAKFEKITYTLNVSVNDSNHANVSVIAK